MGVVNAVLINFNFDALITIDVFLLMFPYVLIYLTVMIMRVKEPDTPRSVPRAAADLGARRLGRRSRSPSPSSPCSSTAWTG